MRMNNNGEFDVISSHRRDQLRLGSINNAFSTVGQLSFAPTTQTTVVTTTTTTTTNLPPLVIRPPRSLSERDADQYPLASAPTPPKLKRFCFDVDGKPTYFREADDAEKTCREYDSLMEDIEHGNGMTTSLIRSEEREAVPSDFESPGYYAIDSPDFASTTTMSPVVQHAAPQDGTRKRAGSPVSLYEAAERVASSSHKSKRRQTVKLRGNDITPTNRGSPVESRRISRSETSSTVAGDEPPFAPPTLAPKPHRPVHQQLTQLQSMVGSMQQQETPLTLSPQLGPRMDANGNSLTPASPSTGASQEGMNIDELFMDPMELTEAEGHGNQLMNDQNGTDVGAQPLSLPSPSISPVTHALTHGNSSGYFPMMSSHPSSLTNSFSTAREAPSQDNKLTNLQQYQHFGVLGIPSMVDSFDAMPPPLKDYLMYQFLKRCSKANLKFVASVVNPILKCDFIARLPLELSLTVIKYLDVTSLCRAAQVSKRWRTVIDTDEWTWRRLLEKDDYTVSNAELDRAIQEGWGYQIPNGNDDCEKDLREYIRGDWTTAKSKKRESRASSTKSQKGRKREMVTHLGKEEFNGVLHDMIGDRVWTDDVDWDRLPESVVGLKSLRCYRLYKSIYRRNHLIRLGWSRPEIKPRHISFRGHPDHVITCLQFDGDKILTGSDDTNINVYDTQTGARKSTLIGHEGGVWALEYEGNTLVSGSTDRTVRVWDIEKGECTQVFYGHTSTVRCLQILMPAKITLPSGKTKMMPAHPLIVTGSRDSSVRIWKLPKPGDPTFLPARLPEGINGNQITSLLNSNPYYIRSLNAHTNSVRAIAAHGDTLVSGSYDFSVRVWKISTGESLHRLNGHTNKVYSVVLDHERNRCISGSMDSMVKVWSLADGSNLYTLQGHNALVGLLDLSHDWLVSAAADATLRIWDPETGNCRHTLRSHQTAITCFQHDGTRVVSGSDGTLKMFDLKTGKFVRDLLTDLTLVWQVRFNERQCVAAVKRDEGVYIEVLDFSAQRDGVPQERLGHRITVNEKGEEIEEQQRVEEVQEAEVAEEAEEDQDDAEEEEEADEQMQDD